MKIFKKTLAMLLSIVMVFGVMPVSVFTASAENLPISDIKGDGTANSPYVADTYEKLKALAEYDAYGIYIIVEKDVDIYCPEALQFYGKKTLIVFGDLSAEKDVIHVWETAYIKGTGTISSVNGSPIYAGNYDSDAIVELDGNITYTSENDYAVYLYNGSEHVIYDGTFTSGTSSSVYVSSSAYLTVHNGSFPNGINYTAHYQGTGLKLSSDRCVALDKEGNYYQDSVPVNMPVTIYELDFLTQSPEMPGKYDTTLDLGKHPLGTQFTFSYTTKELPKEFEDAGFFIEESMELYDIDDIKTALYTQNSGKAFIIPDTVYNTYALWERITLKYKNDWNQNVTVCSFINSYIVEYSNVFNISGRISGAKNPSEVKVSLYKRSDNSLVKTTYPDSYGNYILENVDVGEYKLEVTGDLYYTTYAYITVVNKSLTQDFTMSSSVRTISGKIEGTDSFSGITLLLYKESDGSLYQKITPDENGNYCFENVEMNTTYTLKATKNYYESYNTTIHMNQSNVEHTVVLRKLKDISGYVTGTIFEGKVTVELYRANSSEVYKTYTATVDTAKSRAWFRFVDIPCDNYTIVASAPNYTTVERKIQVTSDSTTDCDVAIKYLPDGSEYGFSSQSPAISAEEIIDGHTELGLVDIPPSFSFTVKKLPSNLERAGYTVKTQTQVKYSSGVTETFDSTTWTCGNYYYGTNKVTQIVMLIDPDGNEVGRKTHTYTFTYAKLYFETRTPGVTNEQAAAGVSELGTLTTAPKFAFTAYPLSSDLTKEGYSQTVKMEAYQDGELVYSADNGNTYIHIYPGEGKVVQTITLIDPDGNEVGSLAHTYNFTVEFPEGTIALDADFLTLAENSTHQLSATFAPESLAETLVWTSSNHAVARVDSNGKITAVRPGSVLITATLGNGATAYCTVLVTAEDVKAYVGGIGLAEGEYLAQGSNAPTTVKPADNYAYLATVNGKLTLTLHNFSYSGMGTFTSKNAAYGIYSTQELKVVAEGTNKIGPMSAPVDRYTSYGIGKGDSVSITSDANSMLTITGVSTGISSSRYVMVSGNLNITDVTSGISCTHAQAMGGLNFQSGNVNINCTGTAISVTGNYINFSGADVTINCKAGINLVRQGEITIDDGSLKMYASASGINIKSGQAMTVNGGTAYIEAVNNAVALEGALNVNGGSIVLISTDTASDSSYSALYGAGTVTLGSGVTGIASTGSTTSSTTSFNSANIKTYDYVCFRDSGYVFVKQPVGGEVKGGGTMTVTWQTGFKPVKLELVTYNGKTTSTTTLTASATSSQLGVLPEGGYYQIRAYYSTSYYITSDKFYVYSMGHNVTFDSGVDAQLVADGELAVKPSDPEKDNKFFYGWLTPDGKVFDFSTPITEDLVLKAGWADVMVDGVAMPNGSYRGMYSSTATTGRPSGSYAHYKDGVLTLYNYNNSYGSGIAFGEIDLTVVSTGEGNAVSCIVSNGDYVNLTIDGTATLNIGHELWTYNAIYIYDTVTFKCDTVIECIDSVVVCDVEGFVVDGADVIIKGYADMAWANGIYGCEAPITVLDGSLYIYCEGGETITDSYITNPDRVTVYANNNLDGAFTDDDIITKVDEAYDLEDYTQIKIVHKHTTVVRYGLAPTCWTTGIADHYECVCGKLFSDAEGTEEITDLEAWQAGEGVLQVADHNWDHLNGECAYGCRTVAFEVRHGAVLDRGGRYIFGLDAGILHIGDYTRILIDGYEWTYENGIFDQFGTGSKAILTNGETVIAEYTILIYGDLNGDSWYDGEDAFLVNLIVKGMLKQHDLPEYMWMAADCNHDGVIDETDVDILTGAGLKLNSVDQNKAVSDLLSNSDYIEYAMLIDQSAGMSVEPDVDDSQQGTTTPETNETVEPDEPAEDSYFGIFISKVFLFIRKIFNFVFSFVIK